MPVPAPLLQVSGLRNRHAPRSNIPASLSLESGTVMCLSGPSGSGKTLLLRAIADLDPNDGEVYLAGIARIDFTAPEWRRRVTYVAAEPAWWATTVAEHFDSGAQEMFEQAGLAPAIMDRQIATLSTGERQRLALLRALSGQPRVLLLDEPTAALNQENTRRIERLLCDYLHRYDAGALWISHSPDQIARIARHHLTIAEGRVRAAGDTEER